MGRFISAAVLRDMAKLGKNIVLEEDSVLTPSAKDLAKELGITISKGREEIIGHNVVGQAGVQLINSESGVKAVSVSSGTEVTNTKDTDLKKAVQKILGEVLKPACANPKATHVKGETVVIQPFPEAPPGQKVGLVDVIDSRVGNLASGFMTFDHSRLPWFLNYDEVDYVIEGEFVLEVGGQVFRAKAGDVLYIPKGSQVVFSSPTFCKVFYCTYPANWAEFCD
ncbi:cupin domain-containing protein [Desulfosporosinus meridiei]|uniref:Ethanolamine utilization protein n=1 Tax=Desulfosporosinus meridiei (strain ATCC BAA-275 / DSM 13257 / KCTC 12902 / NCIMB 13706 / S10) TaxID=768704 RepID=J7IPF9_DESMD|nr:cupin domain-containing protein [Desulfosporosinus meridiei]AFQ43727.1 ethanolamine utilization protein [Desulfosporosinus meridiei DSM 13257]